MSDTPHRWDEGITFLDLIVSTCELCGQVRTRQRIAGVDYISGAFGHVDMVGTTEEGWEYDEGTTDNCPGEEATE